MKEERGKNRPSLRQESNLRPFAYRAIALPTELRRQGLSKRQLSQLFLPLKDAGHYFLQTLLQLLDPTPESFPNSLDRAAVSQKVRIMKKALFGDFSLNLFSLPSFILCNIIVH